MSLSELVSLRCCPGSEFRSSVPPSVCCSRRLFPFPPLGPLGRFPCFIGTMGRSDSSWPVPTPLLSLGMGTPLGEPRALPGSWAALARVPRSRTPVGPGDPTTWSPRCCLPPKSTASAPTMSAVSGLNHAAHVPPVYASRGQSPERAQHSVPDGGQPCPDGTLTRRAADRDF